MWRFHVTAEPVGKELVARIGEKYVLNEYKFRVRGDAGVRDGDSASEILAGERREIDSRVEDRTESPRGRKRKRRMWRDRKPRS